MNYKSMETLGTIDTEGFGIYSQAFSKELHGTREED